MNQQIVSFVIPTLNRGRYVVRAVESCLVAARNMPEVDVQVVVLDSMSDDGSWKVLVDRFSADNRVVLAQNARGLGPTHSWLDGARLVTGRYVTFLWSDDYVSPDFLQALVPALRDHGCGMAMGDGCIRDIDVDEPLPRGSPHARVLSGSEFVRRHLGLKHGRGLPVSPAAALFSRQVFDCWIEAVEQWCTVPGVRHDIMWRRAIGPDLMLFLMAGLGEDDRVMLDAGIVAQFSSHTGSISLSSSAWPLRAGYWLAKKWAVDRGARAGSPLVRAGYARLTVQGAVLSRQVSSDVPVETAQSFADEVDMARAAVFRSCGRVAGSAALAASAIALGWRQLRRLVRA